MCLGNSIHRVVPKNMLDSEDLNVSEIVKSCEYEFAENVSTLGNLSVLHLNIRSLNKNLENLKELIVTLTKQCVMLDVILLCETWLHSGNMALINIEGYTCLTKNRDSTGGGLAILVRKQYKPEIVKELTVTVPGQYESLFVKIPMGDRDLFLGELYRVPNSNISLFQEHVDKITSVCKGKNCILGADQNLDLLKHSNHKPTGKFLDSIIESELIPLIQKPTRVTHNSYSLIDNLYVSSNLVPDSKATILVEYLSDHFPCLAQLNWPFKREKHAKIVYTRKLNEKKLLSINHDLLHKNWLELMGSDNDLDLNYSTMISTIKNSIDKFAPLTRKMIKPSNVLKLPWMSVSLLKSTKKCKYLYQRSLTKSKNSPERIRFVKYRNCLNKLKMIAKKDFVNNVIDSYKGDTKQIWRMINNLACRNNDKTGMVSELLVDDKLITDNKDICDSLNTHFGTAGRRATVKCSKDSESHKKYLKK